MRTRASITLEHHDQVKMKDLCDFIKHRLEGGSLTTFYGKVHDQTKGCPKVLKVKIDRQRRY